MAFQRFIDKKFATELPSKKSFDKKNLDRARPLRGCRSGRAVHTRPCKETSGLGALARSLSVPGAIGAGAIFH